MHFAYVLRYPQVPDIPAALARCLDGLASCAQPRCAHSVVAEVATCSEASACSTGTCGADGSARTLWVRACCALLERAAPAALSGSLLQQARSLTRERLGTGCQLCHLLSCVAAGSRLAHTRTSEWLSEGQCKRGCRGARRRCCTSCVRGTAQPQAPASYLSTCWSCCTRPKRWRWRCPRCPESRACAPRCMRGCAPWLTLVRACTRSRGPNVLLNCAGTRVGPACPSAGNLFAYS